MLGNWKTIFGLALGVLAHWADAASITNNSVADTSLLEIEPSHNNGGQASVISGHIQNPFLTRGLYRFDLNNLPTNALIQSVVLELTVTAQPGDGLANSAFGLHRMLRPWGEGDKIPVARPGQGEPATAGEATWSHSFYPTNAWAVPGGAPDVDFVGSESSSAFIYGAVEAYRFLSNPEIVGDVQGWVNDPTSSFGWMLICGDEPIPFTARHFGSRENPGYHPNLEVEFLVPPRIESAQRVGGQFQLSFTTWPGQSYIVEFRPALAAGVWQTLTNTGLATNMTLRVVADPITAPQRLYRVMAY